MQVYVCEMTENCRTRNQEPEFYKIKSRVAACISHSSHC